LKSISLFKNNLFNFRKYPAAAGKKDLDKYLILKNPVCRLERSGCWRTSMKKKNIAGLFILLLRPEEKGRCSKNGLFSLAPSSKHRRDQNGFNL